MAAETPTDFKPLWGKQLLDAIQALLDDAEQDDATLRSELERLSRQWAFAGYTWFWGPRLWERNRVLFRPFILAHFATWERRSKHQWKPVKWKGTIGKALDQWLQSVEATEEVALFQSLLNWQVNSQEGIGVRGSKRAARFRRELMSRFESATSPGERQLVLDRFRSSWWMDEDVAVKMYQLDHRCADFLASYLPVDWWSGEKRTLWPRLQKMAHDRGDEDFAWKIYRSRVPTATWKSDAIELCNTVSDTDRLIEELEKRHPRGYSDLGATFAAMLDQRGRELLPYVTRHLFDIHRGVIFRGGYKKILDVARSQEWYDFEAAVLRVCGTPGEFSKAVEALFDSNLSEENVESRLSLLAGTSREWNFPGLGFAKVHVLKDEVAMQLYQRFPDLLRGPFKPHIQSNYGKPLVKTTDAFIEAGDEEMIDFMASRAVVRGSWRYGGETKPWKALIEKLSDYYQAIKSTPSEFCIRSIEVLVQVPAYSIFDYRQLIRSNPLARLLLQRSPEEFLAHPPALSDLVEAQEIHVMALAYRVLGLDDDRARMAAADNLDVLIGTLLRPLHRRTRMAAFGALLNAASVNEDHAIRVLGRAREALDLPDNRYPKESLVGLIGRILHRWPDLRNGQLEAPIIYRDKVA